MSSAGSIGVGLAGIAVVIAIAANAAMNGGPPRDLSKAEAVADASGNLHVPDDYHQTYEFLGSWAVAADQGGASKELHDVYASPGTIAAYRKDGKFPDGAVLVKEVFQATTKAMTTGTVSRADTLKGWFVMVKDNKDLH